MNNDFNPPALFDFATLDGVTIEVEQLKPSGTGIQKSPRYPFIVNDDSTKDLFLTPDGDITE